VCADELCDAERQAAQFGEVMYPRGRSEMSLTGSSKANRLGTNQLVSSLILLPTKASLLV
jgi:hypothetical protein